MRTGEVAAKLPTNITSACSARSSAAVGLPATPLSPYWLARASPSRALGLFRQHGGLLLNCTPPSASRLALSTIPVRIRDGSGKYRNYPNPAAAKTRTTGLEPAVCIVCVSPATPHPRRHSPQLPLSQPVYYVAAGFGKLAIRLSMNSTLGEAGVSVMKNAPASHMTGSRRVPVHSPVWVIPGSGICTVRPSAGPLWDARVLLPSRSAGIL